MLGGTGRSGTNILKKILGRHPDVLALPFEHRILIDPDGIVDFVASMTDSWSPYCSDVRLRRLESFLHSKARRRQPLHTIGSIIKHLDPSGLRITAPPYHGWELEKWFPGYAEHVTNLMQALKEFEYPGRWPGAPGGQWGYRLSYSPPRSQAELAGLFGTFVNRLVKSALEVRGRTYFVEDNTWNILFADVLAAIIPQARLVHIHRDPRDVVTSFLQQHWCPNDTAQAVAWYLGIWKRWSSVRAELDEQTWLSVRFEDLVANPQAEVERICSFTGIPFDPDMVRIELSRHNIGRWERELSTSDRAILRSELKPVLEELGYA